MAAPGGVLALPAPAPPPPVVVTVGAPLAARCLAFIPTNDPIVQRTRFLPWTDHAAVGGAAATSSIPAYVLLRHFIVRCTIGGLPADLVSSSNSNSSRSLYSARRSFPSGLSFSRMMTTSQGGGVGDAKGSVASELTDA